MRTEDETPDGGAPGADDRSDGVKPTPRRRNAQKSAGVRKAGATGRGAGRKAQPADGTTVGAPEAASAGTDGGAVGAFKTRDLVDRVAKVAGLKRRSAKPLVETVLGELAAALQAGRPLSLRPLGKVTVSKTRESGGGHVLVCRIRQRGPKPAAAGSAETPDEALAEVAEGR